jgi:hypothetical protein
MAKISKENARSQAVILPARAFCFEIEAILTSFRFDRFRPLLRWRTLRYPHIPAARRLALNESASNLSDAIYEFTAL